MITDPVEAWLYFFRHADEMTTEEIDERFQSAAFSEAAEVLDMIQRTPQQRNQYELRLKAQRDERARMQYAVDQARAEGEARGRLIGQIEMLRGLLRLESSQLDDLSQEELVVLANDLQQQLRDRGV